MTLAAINVGLTRLWQESDVVTSHFVPGDGDPLYGVTGAVSTTAGRSPTVHRHGVMYQTVQLSMAASEARDRLLAAAVEHAMRGGISDLSLRELATAIGTSHRMLLYHFGSREGLLAAVAQAVEEGQRAAVEQIGLSVGHAQQLWQHFSDPRLWPAERLFFELYAQALLGRPGTEGFLNNAIEPWVAAMAPAIARKAGLDDKTARSEARLIVAITRGLLLDLLATGDHDGVTEALERYLQHAGRLALDHGAQPDA